MKTYAKHCLKHFLVVGLSTWLFGCGSEPDHGAENSPENSAKHYEDDTLRQDNGLLDTQLDALERARDTEKSMSDAVDAREQEMRERGI